MDAARFRFDQFAVRAAAFLLASLAAAFALVFPVTAFLPFAFLVTLAHALLFALPVFLILLGQSERSINGISAATSGFLIGTLSASFFLWPSCYKCSSSYNGVILVNDGVVTAAGWLSFGLQILRIGFAGAFGGFIFWLTLNIFGFLPKTKLADRPQRSSAYRTLAASIALAAAILLVIGAFATVGLQDWARMLGF
jgi:hypothetical protein